MRWLENIRLRIPGHLEKNTKNKLQKLLHDLAQEKGLLGVSIFVNALQSGDLALNLYWDTPERPIQGSRLGLSLTGSLRSFGMVNHSIWTPANGFISGRKNYDEKLVEPF